MQSLDFLPDSVSKLIVDFVNFAGTDVWLILLNDCKCPCYTAKVNFVLKFLSVAMETKASEHYFPQGRSGLFIMLYIERAET